VETAIIKLSFNINYRIAGNYAIAHGHDTDRYGMNLVRIVNSPLILLMNSAFCLARFKMFRIPTMAILTASTTRRTYFAFNNRLSYSFDMLLGGSHHIRFTLNSRFILSTIISNVSENIARPEFRGIDFDPGMSVFLLASSLRG